MPLAVLDPGHGVDTPGKRSPNGLLREYEFNGDVAARAQAILTTAGVDAILTRPATATAKDVSLADRVAIANRRNASLFVSIHANAHGSGREWTPARGYEVYIYTPGGKAEVLAQRLVKWATELLLPFDPHFPMRGIKTANFYVLRKTKMPAVLIEHGFMTNEADYALLRSNEFRQACAEHIARAVCEHLGVRYPTPKPAQKAEAPKPVEVKPVADPGPFKDIPKNDWAADAIAWCKEKGIIQGFDDGTFRPNQTVTRKELAVILYRALKNEGK